MILSDTSGSTDTFPDQTPDIAASMMAGRDHRESRPAISGTQRQPSGVSVDQISSRFWATE